MTDVFAKRRSALLEQLGSHALLVLAAAPELIAGRDTELRYLADAELFYLTGYTEPEAVLVLGPAHAEHELTMFVRPRDAARELWTGRRGGEEAARELFGADAAYPISDLMARLSALVANVDVVYARLGGGRSEVDAALAKAMADARRTRPRTGTAAHTLIDPGELLDPMRVIKDEHELALMREAARISCQAFCDALARVRPGVGEWQIEAALDFGFRSLGGDGPAFPTIAAAGSNATVLHYIANNAVTKAGDLLLLDAGARHQMYCADITRTVPVSGTFTNEQRRIYDVVLAAHDAAIAAARPGATTDDVHSAAQRELAAGLMNMGLVQGTIDDAIAADDGLRKYYPHRTSHWLGLDVHDVGAYATREGAVRLVPGMVMTIEPGLYIAHKGIGIRIEDDIVISNRGCEVLTAAVPTDAHQLEAIIRGGS